MTKRLNGPADERNYDQRKREYLDAFAEMSPEKQIQHIAFALHWITSVLAAQADESRRLEVLDENTINGEYTTGGAV